ncbi:transmembrane protein [Ceratobasidium sp. AG-Ba]|nr:transmembrane protein [Ceratobasidium sp. AG-Ba]
MRLDVSFLVGVWLEAVVYGIYLAALAVCLRLFRTRTLSVGRALPIWLVALFILATAHCALSLSATLDAFVRQMVPVLGTSTPSPFPSPPHVPTARPGQVAATPTPTPSPSRLLRHDPVSYVSNRALPNNLASLGVYAGIILVSDLMMLYRLLVMYKYKFVWTIVPGLLSLASFVISMIVVSKYARVDLSLSTELIQKQLASVDSWVPPVYAISFLASLAITALMMIRTSYASSSLKPTLPAFARRGRRHGRSTSLTAGDGFVFDIDERTGPLPDPAPTTSESGVSPRWVILAGLVESGAFLPVFMLAALILYVVQGGQETILVPLLSPLAALVPTLQIVQIQLGLDSATRTAPSPRNAVAPAAPGGRSPYIVPGPRYRDDFSSDEEPEDGEDKANLLGQAMAKQNASKRPDPGARRWSARWAWRGSGSGSGHGSGSGSQSSSSNGRPEPIVALPMQDLSSRSGPRETGVWQHVKLDESAPRRGTLRKSSGPVMKEMISKPVPVAPDFPPPTTANIPSTPLPSFVISSAQGGTVAKASLARVPSGNLGRAPNGKDEHKYHYRMRPREKTASSLAAYLNAQAEEALSNTGHGSSQNLKVGSVGNSGSGSGHLNPVAAHANPNSESGYVIPNSVSGHTNPMSLPSTVPTSPASGFTSLAPNSMNPFRYDATTPPPPQHKRSYSDLQRGDAPQPTMTGVGLSGSSRTPLTFPFAPPNAADESVPRWAAPPGAPFIPGLGGGHGRTYERDVSPAPGLQQDYARAREEVLRQMQRERAHMNGAMSDDESVYSTQPQPLGGPGWRAFPGHGR